MAFDLVVNGLRVQLGSSKILDGVELKVSNGEMLGIIGPNGSGKTTLLNCISRTVSPTAGEILVFGKPARSYNNLEYSKAVSAMLPQWPRGFSMKSYEVVLMGCRNRSGGIWWEGESELEVTKAALRVLNALELYDRDFDTLSSGEQRKVLIAKSLAQRTGIILLDEPVAYLDMKHKLEVMDVLRALSRLGKTVILALHEIELASKYCDNVLVLSRGQVVAAGKPREVITPELLRRVYGVEAEIKWDEEHNYPVIVPRGRKVSREEVSCLK